jgi:hypothetical protein
LATGAGAWLAHKLDPWAPYLVLLDACAFVPLLVTGCTSQLPPGVDRAARWLAPLHRTLTRDRSLRCVVWGRVLTGAGGRPDEVRLLAMPRAVMPGLVGVEAALAWCRTPTCWVGSPEILVRFLDGSAAAARIAARVPGARTLPGRRPEERVIALSPRFATRASARDMVIAMCAMFVDRRADAGAWSGPERRVARNVRVPAPVRVAAHGDASSHTNAIPLN